MELVNGLPILNKKSEKENIANIFFNLGKTVGFWQKEKENVARDKEFTAQQTALLEQARAQLQQQMQLLASLMIGIQAQNNQLKQVNPPYPPLNIGGGQPAEVPPPSPNNPPIPPEIGGKVPEGIPGGPPPGLMEGGLPVPPEIVGEQGLASSPSTDNIREEIIRKLTGMG